MHGMILALPTGTRVYSLCVYSECGCFGLLCLFNLACSVQFRCFHLVSRRETMSGISHHGMGMNFSLLPGHVYVMYAYSGELGYCHHVVSMGVETSKRLGYADRDNF